MSNLVYSTEVGLVIVTTASGALFGINPLSGKVATHTANWHTGAGVPLLMGADKNLLMAQNLSNDFSFGFSAIIM